MSRLPRSLFLAKVVGRPPAPRLSGTGASSNMPSSLHRLSLCLLVRRRATHPLEGDHGWGGLSRLMRYRLAGDLGGGGGEQEGNRLVELLVALLCLLAQQYSVK